MNQLSLAVICFLGYGSKPYPSADPSRLCAEFGPDLARRLELEVNILLDEIDALWPDRSDWSALPEEIRSKYPGLSRRALDALVWAYSWGRK